MRKPFGSDWIAMVIVFGARAPEADPSCVGPDAGARPDCVVGAQLMREMATAARTLNKTLERTSPPYATLSYSTSSHNSE